MTTEKSMDGMYVLITTDHRTHYITKEQAIRIAGVQASGQKTLIEVAAAEGDMISSTLIGSIVRWSTYERQMQHKLMERNQRMCKRCGNIVTRSERCPCRDMGGEQKYPSLVSVLRLENPKLDTALKQLEAKMSVPSLDVPASQSV